MDNNYQIVFTADTSNALAGMKLLEQEFRRLESYVNGTGSGLGVATSALNNMAQGCQALGTDLGAASEKAKGFHLSVLEIGKAWAITGILDAGAMAIQNIADSATKTRDRIKELAIETMDLRDKMRELANLQGHGGPDDEVAAEALELGVKSGMMPPEAVKFLEQYEGSSPAGMQKHHIDFKTKDELAVEGARFATRLKINPATGGDLAGVISQYTDLTTDEDGRKIETRKVMGKDGKERDEQITTGTDKAMAQMGRVAYGLNEGRGNLEPLVRGLINTAGSIVSQGGPVEDLGDLAAVYGAASTHANPKETGTRVQQAVRALRDTKGDAGMFLRSAGIKDDDSHVERLGKVKKRLDEAKGRGIANDTFLQDNGFGDKDEIKAVIEQANDIGLIRQRIAKGKKIDGASVRMADDEFFRADKVGRRRIQKSTRAVQDFEQGRENEEYEMAKDTADMNLRKHKGTWAYTIGKTVNDLGGVLPMLGAMPSEERWKMQLADRDLVGKARQAGIPEEHIWDDLGVKVGTNEHRALMGKQGKDLDDSLGETRRWHADKDRVIEYNRLRSKVERAQGNPNPAAPDLLPALHAIAHEARETNRILKEKARDTFVGPPRPGAAPVGPMRGAAAPKRP